MKLIASPYNLTLVFLLFIACLPASAQYHAADVAIDDIMKETAVAGLSVAVVKNNKLVYTKAFGYKDIEKKQPLSTQDIFRIASISKSFTATGLMQMVEKKKISLDDDVSDLIGFTVRNPRYPDKPITLRMILSHTSSINDSQGYFTLDVINPEKNEEWENCYSDYPPGEGYKYCNLNFNMAGTILERASNEIFDHYIINHILKPLDLYGGYNVNELDSSLFATIYNYDKKTQSFIPSPGAYARRIEELDNYEMYYSTPIFSPTGGMKISAPDLARYMMMHMNYGTLDGRKIISRKSEKAMRKAISKDANYGLALRTTNKLIPGQTLIGHTGSAYGLYSSMFFHPKKKYGIVVICSGTEEGGDGELNVLIGRVANALYKEVVTGNK